jgi:hypothetical protein
VTPRSGRGVVGPTSTNRRTGPGHRSVAGSPLGDRQPGDAGRHDPRQGVHRNGTTDPVARATRLPRPIEAAGPTEAGTTHPGTHPCGTAHAGGGPTEAGTTHPGTHPSSTRYAAARATPAARRPRRSEARRGRRVARGSVRGPGSGGGAGAMPRRAERVVQHAEAGSDSGPVRPVRLRASGQGRKPAVPGRGAREWSPGHSRAEAAPAHRA